MDGKNQAHFVAGLRVVVPVTASGDKIVNVLIPASPTPWSGFFQLLKRKDISGRIYPLKTP